MKYNTEIIELCSQLIILKNITDELDSFYTNKLFEPSSSIIFTDEHDSTISASEIERLKLFWDSTTLQLDSIFYRISSYYHDEIERIIKYPFLTKAQFLALLDKREMEKDKEEDSEMENWSNEGREDFYEGFDETYLGID
ncbi:MAG TPA: hypothetical protein VKT28_21445 [Puia sp.]|nr:hypothetical protein [Puia sp.]